jgi:hypothetical protein
MSTGEQKAFCWGQVSAPAPCINLADVMSEELAVQLHKEEERGLAGLPATPASQVRRLREHLVLCRIFVFWVYPT